MKISEIATLLNLEWYVKADENREVIDGYCSDLLSDVMGKAPSDSLWITLQNHKNVVAVASLRDITGVVLVHNIAPSEDMINYSQKEGINLLVSKDNHFELCGKLYKIVRK
ncbi:serine kinase [bacterium]|nr:serine kinase [bacterium]